MKEEVGPTKTREAGGPLGEVTFCLCPWPVHLTVLLRTLWRRFQAFQLGDSLGEMGLKQRHNEDVSCSSCSFLTRSSCVLMSSSNAACSLVCGP